MVVPSGLGEACRAAYARHASSHVHANRLLRLAALWDRPCGSGLLCAHQASSPRVNYKGLRTKTPPLGTCTDSTGPRSPSCQCMWPGGVSASKLRTSTCEWPPQRNPLKLLEVIPMSWLSVCWQTKFSKRRTKQHKQCAGGACSLRASPTPHCRSHNAANLNTACSHVHDTSGSSNTECFSGPAICACASRVLVGLCIGMRIGMRICIRSRIRSRIRLCHRKVLISTIVRGWS